MCEKALFNVVTRLNCKKLHVVVGSLEPVANKITQLLTIFSSPFFTSVRSLTYTLAFPLSFSLLFTLYTHHTLYHLIISILYISCSDQGNIRQTPIPNDVSVFYQGLLVASYVRKRAWIHQHLHCHLHL